MTVKQLKEKLTGVDENLVVYFYSNLEEAGGEAYSATTERSFPYCQGDPPDDLEDTFFLIRCD